MILIFAFGITFVLLILSVYKGVFLGYALMTGLLIFSLIALKKGCRPFELLKIIMRGGRKSFIVIQIFVLIGAVIAIWMASGTVPAIVYYGVKSLKPDTFILSAFLISAVISSLMGTSVGTSGTVGVALILIAKSGGVSIPAAAGAIIAGAYFGDRCSPMSSSANLVAFVTKTEIYENVKNMFRSCVVPLVISVAFYFAVSEVYPLKADGGYISSEILNTFNVNPVVLIPVAIIIIFSIFKINVKYSIICSIIAAAAIGIFLQHLTAAKCLNYIIYGYSMDKNLPLYSIIKGGGMLSMVNTSIVLFIASALAGVIEETKMLEHVEDITVKAQSRFEIFRNVLITSIFTSAIGCCQAFTIILTNVLNEKAYERIGIDKNTRALDLENTSVLVSALIPWNLSLVLPMAVLGADYSCLPYLMYIYILPLWYLAYYFIKYRTSYVRELSSP